MANNLICVMRITVSQLRKSYQTYKISYEPTILTIRNRFTRLVFNITSDEYSADAAM